MRRFSQHIVVIGRLLVILFVLSNSGFTAVLHQCDMKEKKTAQSNTSMECCGASQQDEHAACDVPQKTASSTHGTHFTCHTYSVVGGALGTSALLLAEQSKTRLSKHGDWSARFPQQTLLKPIVHNLFTPSNLAISTSPPSVEKCILNSSFLI